MQRRSFDDHGLLTRRLAMDAACEAEGLRTLDKEC